MLQTGAVVFAANGDITLLHPATHRPLVQDAEQCGILTKPPFQCRLHEGGIDWDKTMLATIPLPMGSSTRAVGIASVALGNGTRTDGNYAHRAMRRLHLAQAGIILLLWETLPMLLVSVLLLWETLWRK